MSSDAALIREYSYQLERVSWLIVFFSMLTQLSSDFTFPSYNLVLGFWGAYCAFSKHGRATFGLVMFYFFGVLLDIVFSSVNTIPGSSLYRFCFAMFIFCLFLKLYGLYISSHYFAALGGASTMENSTMIQENLYESLATSMEGSQTAGYYPPNESFMDSSLYPANSPMGKSQIPTEV